MYEGWEKLSSVLNQEVPQQKNGIGNSSAMFYDWV